MPRVLIAVTQRDIDESDPADPFSCPVACAVRRRIDSSAYIVTVVDSVRFRRPDSRRCYRSRLSAAVDKWITRFDDDKPVKPIRFYLNIPKKYLKQKESK